MVTQVSDENLLWNMMRKIKDESNEEENKECFVHDDTITENFKNLSKILGVNDVEEGIIKISDRDIQRGVEKFLYLNSCKNEATKRKWKQFYDSTLFYENYITPSEKLNRTVKEIVLSVMKPLKSLRSRDGQIIANKFTG